MSRILHTHTRTNKRRTHNLIANGLLCIERVFVFGVAHRFSYMQFVIHTHTHTPICISILAEFAINAVCENSLHALALAVNVWCRLYRGCCALAAFRIFFVCDWTASAQFIWPTICPFTFSLLYIFLCYANRERCATYSVLCAYDERQQMPADNARNKNSAPEFDRFCKH